MKKTRKLVYGVGINDLTYVGNEKAYTKWASMLNRCYSPNIKWPTYNGCSVCDEWKLFSNFKKWYDNNNRSGMELDKDILVRGNKVYDPQYCRFVPSQINTLLLDHGAKRGKYKQGVYWNKCAQKFLARIRRGNGTEHIGYYSTELEAFTAYKMEKEKWIKHQADYYYSIGQIGKDVYDALYNWTI